MKVVLYQPQIPPNTGNVVRTCAVTGTDLVLVKPLGFSTNDRWLKRAGLDYWEGVNVKEIDDFEAFLNEHPDVYFFSSHAKKLYTDVVYTQNTTLVFGSETAGLPKWVAERYPDRLVKIPMIDNVRCLNLATSVGIGVYEAIRQRVGLGIGQLD
jgi:tRNA (cytidine/uridine-2'-O-)-methyltransferase